MSELRNKELRAELMLLMLGGFVSLYFAVEDIVQGVGWPAWIFATLSAAWAAFFGAIVYYSKNWPSDEGRQGGD